MKWATSHHIHWHRVTVVVGNGIKEPQCLRTESLIVGDLYIFNNIRIGQKFGFAKKHPPDRIWHQWNSLNERETLRHQDIVRRRFGNTSRIYSMTQMDIPPISIYNLPISEKTLHCFVDTERRRLAWTLGFLHI